MDDLANEWSSPTRELTRNNLASLVRRSHRTSRVEPLRTHVPAGPPVYPTHPSSPMFARLALAFLAIALALGAMYLLYPLR